VEQKKAAAPSPSAVSTPAEEGDCLAGETVSQSCRLEYSIKASLSERSFQQWDKSTEDSSEHSLFDNKD